jgi:hypothetical protein
MAILSDPAGNLYAGGWTASGCFCSTTLFRIPSGATSASAQIAIDAADRNASSVPRSLAFSVNGIYTNDLRNNAVEEFNLGLTAKTATITTAIGQPYALAVEP